MLTSIWQCLGTGQGTWQGHIQIPSLPPSDLPGCSIIDLQYRLLVSVVKWNMSLCLF